MRKVGDVTTGSGITHHEDRVFLSQCFHQFDLDFIFRHVPSCDDAVVSFIIGDQTTTELFRDVIDFFVRSFQNFCFGFQYQDIGDPYSDTCTSRDFVTQVLHFVQHLRSFRYLELLEDGSNDISKVFLLERSDNFLFLDERLNVFAGFNKVFIRSRYIQVELRWFVQIREFIRHDFVKEDLTDCRHQQTASLPFCPWFLRQRIRADRYSGMQMDKSTFISQTRFFSVGEDHSFADFIDFFQRQVIVTQDHILGWGYDWFTIFWIQDVLCSQHQ